MSTMSQAMAAYGTARRAQTPLKIVVDLYDLALTSVSRAKAARMTETFEAEFEAMSKATLILSELERCLNTEDPRAQSMSKTLRQFYKRTITQLHAAKQARGGDEAIGTYASVHSQIMTMREAWAEIAGAPSLVARSVAG
ncbi:flagellar export chaperone FliS [Rhodospirillum rubrum]|uniref:Flagellar protein FliS n=1 Tax=Rhodospirillum rubrum (strain ATCC 11170 / ATH 1.1.1 / DSM 467 / LMG 4362 / NCIMB 8255 / S1) TaxID=269796 RepID=Q2RRA9_RHORT|nr:flagellar export chaperone FliS [Rhodospirillum rubrum]ABC23336.1 hypothetical protein Rru_A2536 [Rhodospirillum rubrum ATCC 11170]MBK5954979.1 flagellar protein FliS [Rhodospirillum rubrum]QXG79309.1 flagellar protein FliS [Rhodospirillum rubrum]HAQ01270.1 flagellar protein FliS [Rhodospirillum rubrum]HCF18804.1 flagellar protein FliS [Rhodospirillum rubrum]